MALRSFDDGNSDEARQFLLDRRCERNHPKRHRTQKRKKKLAKRKRQKIEHKTNVRLMKSRRYHAAVRAYWRGEGDHP